MKSNYTCSKCSSSWISFQSVISTFFPLQFEGMAYSVHEVHVYCTIILFTIFIILLLLLSIIYTG